MATLANSDLTLTQSAQEKMAELIGQIEDDIEGIRIFASPGGCSGMSFGMNFADKLNTGDMTQEYDGFKVVVDTTTLEHLSGAEVDFVDRGDGNASFVFNNLPQPAGGGGCGSCGSSSQQGGGCS